MKTFLLLLVLGIILFFTYRRAQDYGLPWQEHVVLARYESSKRYRAGGPELYVNGEVQNKTRKTVEVEVECKMLPPGMTLTPKAKTSLVLQPLETMPFELALTSRREASGAECKVSKWRAEGGLEEKVVNKALALYDRVRRLF